MIFLRRHERSTRVGFPVYLLVPLLLLIGTIIGYAAALAIDIYAFDNYDRAFGPPGTLVLGVYVWIIVGPLLALPPFLIALLLLPPVGRGYGGRLLLTALPSGALFGSAILVLIRLPEDMVGGVIEAIRTPLEALGIVFVGGWVIWAALVALLTAGMFHLAAWMRVWPKPVDARHCRGCGYDLRGTPSAVCPECGRANDANAAR